MKKIIFIMILLLFIPVSLADWNTSVSTSYEFEELNASTTLADSEGGFGTVTETGAGSYQVPMIFGYGREYDSVVWHTGAPTTTISGSFSLCVEIQRELQAGTESEELFYIIDGTPLINIRVYDSSHSNADKILMQYRPDSGALVSLTSPSTLNTSQNTVCLVRDNSDTQSLLYIEGVAVLNTSTASGADFTFTSATLTVGGQTGANSFHGKIGSLRIWDKALTNTEVLDYMESRAPPPSPNPSVTAYNITSAYWNGTTATGSDIAYSRDAGPSINVTLDIAANVSCGIYNQNYSEMISNDSASQAATENSLNHLCTLPDTQILLEGISKMYVAVQGSGTAIADLEMNVSLDWNFTATVKDVNDGSALTGVRLLVSRIADGNSSFGPGGTNSTAHTDGSGVGTCYVALDGNYTFHYEYTNSSAFNATKLGTYEVK